MLKGSLTSYIDVAQLTLYAFWIFFAGLIFYLRREGKREGYPLESERSAHITVRGFPEIPRPKIFRLVHGDTYQAPSGKGDTRAIAARPTAAWAGSPLHPTGDPMLDGVGPAAYAERADVPEMLIDGSPMIVPMRVASEASVAIQDLDPRGMAVVAADRRVAGVVSDLWIDRGEPQIRYLEVEVEVAEGGRHVLLPIGFADIEKRRRRIKVRSIFAAQFATVPRNKSPDQVTKLEEDKITAYYASGFLYGKPSRTESMI